MLSTRWLWHQKHFYDEDHTNTRMMAAYKRYPGKFYFQVIELWPKGTSKNTLERREQFWMDRTPKLFNIVRAGAKRPNSHRPMFKQVGRTIKWRR